MCELNIRARSSRPLSLRRCIDQLRIARRIAVSAFVLAAGLNETPMPPALLAHHSWPERVAEKVELKGRMVLAPTLILAIDDFRLFRMQRQSAFSKPRRKSSPQCCGLVFITTVTDRIIGIALEQYVREVPAHPQIERIVQKEIGQEVTDDPALRRPSLSPDEAPIRHLHRGFQPSVDV